MRKIYFNVFKGGLNSPRPKKGPPKKPKTLDEITNGYMVDAPYEMREGPCAERVVLRKKDRMKKKWPDLPQRETPLMKKKRRAKMIEQLKAGWALDEARARARAEKPGFWRRLGRGIGRILRLLRLRW